MGKILAVIALIGAIVGGYFLVSKGKISIPSTSSSPEIAEVKNKGKIVVGTDATYPPLEYKNEKGEIVGFDLDLAKEIAGGMKVDLEVKNISFDKIFSALEKGEIDLIISSVTITSERQKTMDFSTPYLNAGQVVVVNKDNQEIMDIHDIKESLVGVQSSTTSEEEALKYTDKGNVKKYPDYVLAKTDLLAGKIDAIIIDYPAGISLSQDSGGELKVIGKPFTSEFYGVVVAKGKSGLVGVVDDIIAKLKKSGRLSEIENTWFRK